MERLAQQWSDEEAFAKAEIARHLTVSYVACIEGFCRMAYRDLIDYKPSFRANIPRFELKIGLEHVVAIEGGEMTFGEFISHLLPSSSLDDVSGSMSKLTGESFLDRLKRTPMRLSEAENSLEAMGLESKVFESVRELFRLRHIFAHELTSYEADLDHVLDCAKWGSIFLAVMSRMVTDLVGDDVQNSPISQTVIMKQRLSFSVENLMPNTGLKRTPDGDA